LATFNIISKNQLMIRTYLFFAVLILIACKQPDLYQGEEYVINNVSVISMNDDGNLEDQTVVVRGDSIFHIGEYKAGPNATIIDGSGKYLMPGLTEMHAHIPVAEEGNDTLVKETLFLYLSQGVTTIRGMLGNPYHLTLKEMIAEDKILSPRVYTSSPSLNGGTVETPEEAVEKVSQYKKEGYDFLKIHPGIELEVWDALEKTAKKVGIPYAGHVPVEVGINRALDAGYQTVDHLDGYIDGLIPEDQEFDKDGGGFFGYGFTDLVDQDMISDLVAKTKAKNVAVVPTQTLYTRWFSPIDPAKMLQEPEMKYMPSKTRFSWRQNKERMINDEAYNEEKWGEYIKIRKALLKEMDDQEVNILLGSDAPQVMNVPGFSIHHEMMAMSDSGISAENILRSGTVSPAKFFDSEGEYGQILEGASADLVLLDANPIDNISNASKISGVMVRGQWLSKSAIDERLVSIAKRNQ